MPRKSWWALLLSRVRAISGSVASTFLGRVLVLVGGTGLGQALVAITAPVLTRMYEPEDFGALTAYVAVLSMLLSFSSLRYELAISLPETDEEAANLSIVALLLVCLVSGLTGVGVWLAGHAGLLPDMGTWTWLLPFGLLGAGVYQVATFWSVRKGRFRQLASTKLQQASVLVVSQVALGFSALGGVGLVAGDAISRVAGSGTLVRSAWSEDLRALRSINWPAVKAMAGRYKRFPLVSGPSALLNSAGLQLPLLLMTAFYGVTVTGWFGLAQRIMGTPMALVGQAVAQVYLNEASHLAKEDMAALHRRYVQTAKRLFLLGIVVIVPVAVVGPWLFQWVFGAEWLETGRYLQALAPMLIMQLVVSPLSQTLSVLERLELQFIWDLGRLVLCVITLVVVNELGASAFSAIASYSLVMALAYGILLYLAERAIRREINVEQTH